MFFRVGKVRVFFIGENCMIFIHTRICIYFLYILNRNIYCETVFTKGINLFIVVNIYILYI